MGRFRGGLTSKIHSIVDAAGKAVALSLTPGQRADITKSGPLLDEVNPVFIVDKAYNADRLSKKSKNGRSHRLPLQGKTEIIHGKSLNASLTG
ncbi:transposase [Acetobacter malorum]|uniref:transposase n=1 Tax=Acetobacter malorum TaxID=178901 RepID=UPI0038D000C8